MRIELTYSRPEIQLRLKTGEIRDWVSMDGDVASFGTVGQPTQIGVYQYGEQMRRMIFRLAVLRELQVNGIVDAVSLREKLGLSNGNVSLLSGLFSGAISPFRKNGIVEGEDAGIDPANGYKFKRWVLTDSRKAAAYAKSTKMKLMPPEGKDAIRERFQCLNQ